METRSGFMASDPGKGSTPGCGKRTGFTGRCRPRTTPGLTPSSGERALEVPRDMNPRRVWMPPPTQTFEPRGFESIASPVSSIVDGLRTLLETRRRQGLRQHKVVQHQLFRGTLSPRPP